MMMQAQLVWSECVGYVDGLGIGRQVGFPELDLALGEFYIVELFDERRGLNGHWLW